MYVTGKLARRFGFEAKSHDGVEPFTVR